MLEGNPSSASHKAKPDVFHSDEYQRLIASRDASLLFFLIFILWASYSSFMIAGSYWEGFTVFSAIISVFAIIRGFLMDMKMFLLRNPRS